MKKILYLLFLSCLLCVQVQAQAVLDLDNQDVLRISGTTLNGQAGTPVFIRVLKPGFILDDLPDNPNGALYYFTQMTSKEDGTYLFEVPFDGSKGDYTVLVTTDESDTPVLDTVYYYVSKEEKKDLIDEINSPDTNLGELVSIFDSKARDLELDTTLYSQISKQSLARIIDANRPYDRDDINGFKEAFFNACILTAYNGSQTNLITQDGKLKHIVSFVADTEVIELYDNSLSSSGITLVNAAVLGENFNTDTDFAEQFIEKTIIYAIKNNATFGTEHIGVLLNGFNDYIKADVAKYNSIINKTAIHNSMLNGSYTTFSELRRIIDDYSQPDTGGKTGSGGGSNQTGSYTTNAPVQAPGALPLLFGDLSSVPWASESIEALTRRGVISGKSDGVFAPMDAVTREEFIKMLVLALKVPVSLEDISFTDVAPQSWYYDYVRTAYHNNIITGYDEKTFGAGNNITRQDIAAICFRAAKFEITDEGAEFADENEIAPYAVGAVKTLRKLGIIHGDDSGNFNPREFATRAEAAKIIYGILLFGEGK